MLTNTSRSPRSRHGGGSGCRLQVSGGHAHAEIHAPATRQGTRDIFSTGEVADHDLRSGCAQRFGTFVFAPDKRADRQVALAKYLHNSATHSAYAACGTCDESRKINRQECSSA